MISHVWISKGLINLALISLFFLWAHMDSVGMFLLKIIYLGDTNWWPLWAMSFFLNSLLQWCHLLPFFFLFTCSPALPPSLLVWICNHISCRACIYGIWTKLFLFSHQIIVWSEMEWWRSINSPPVLLCLYHCFGYERLVTSVILLIFTTLIMSVSFFLSSLFQLYISYTSFF